MVVAMCSRPLFQSLKVTCIKLNVIGSEKSTIYFSILYTDYQDTSNPITKLVLLKNVLIISLIVHFTIRN